MKKLEDYNSIILHYETFTEVKNYMIDLTQQLNINGEGKQHVKTIFHLSGIITVNLYEDNYIIVYNLEDRTHKCYKMSYTPFKQ